MTLSRRDFLKATAGTAAYTLIGDHIAAAEVNAGLKPGATDQSDPQTSPPGMNEFKTRWRSRSHLPGRLQPYFVSSRWKGLKAILFPLISMVIHTSASIYWPDSFASFSMTSTERSLKRS